MMQHFIILKISALKAFNKKVLKKDNRIRIFCSVTSFPFFFTEFLLLFQILSSSPYIRIFSIMLLGIIYVNY